MPDEIKVEDCPIVEVVWEDHTTVSPDNAAWATLEELLEKAQPTLVHEVGYVLVNSDGHVVMAHCLSDDEGSKGLSVILSRDIKEWNVLKEAPSDAD